MDPTGKGLIIGGTSLVIFLVATMLLGGMLEREATDEVDDTYSPAREATVNADGWRTPEFLHHGATPASQPDPPR